jgi:hypothetical protein
MNSAIYGLHQYCDRNTFEFKWTVSRGRDTYGYNICSLWINDHKISSCNGGGYDMEGTALGNWMQKAFHDQLKRLKANYGSLDTPTGFYGLSFYNNKRKKRQKTWSKDCSVSLNGACGFSSMERILKRLGYQLRYVTGSRNSTVYTLEKA